MERSATNLDASAKALRRGLRRERLRSLVQSLLEFHRILLVLVTMAIGVVLAALVSP